LKNNNIIQIPTGHGKTIIIAALARVLQDHKNEKDVLEKMNTYLNHHALIYIPFLMLAKRFQLCLKMVRLSISSILSSNHYLR